jgi:hypothetical protein
VVYNGMDFKKKIRVIYYGEHLKRRYEVSNKAKEIKLNLPANVQPGVYSNNMMVSHTREEFVMDFSFITPPVGTVVARITTSPGHMKRIITALQDNVKKYEVKFGTIILAEEPKGPININA